MVAISVIVNYPVDFWLYHIGRYNCHIARPNLNWFQLAVGEVHISSLQGAFVNIDTFKSKIRLLASRFEPEFTVKTVLNQDHGGY